MKLSFLKIVPFFFLILFVTACATDYGPFEFKSPDGGDRSITITGNKATIAAPVMVTVHLVVPKGEKYFTIELAALSLSEENLRVDWENNDKGKITLTQGDGSTKVLDFHLQDDKVHVIQDIKLPESLLH